MVLIYYLLILVFNYVMIISYVAYGNVSFAQPSQNEMNSTLYYGCQQYTVFHCDRLHNKFESYAINSSSSIVYNVTDEPTFVTGKYGMALQMYANHLKSIMFSNTSTISPKQFSITFWIKATSLPGEPVSPGIGNVISQFDQGVTGGWAFKSSNMENPSKESVQFSVFNNQGEAFTSPDIRISQNNFTHVVGTFDGSLIKVYKDGAFLGQTKFNGTYNNNIRVPLTLGVASGSPMLYYWTGEMDDLRYYDKVISISDIQKLLHEGSINSNSSNNLIGHWDFNGNLNDISGKNRHGVEHTLISSMVFAPDGRLFFAEKDTGKIKILENNKVKSEPFAIISNHHSNWEQGLLGLAVDPDFKRNHFIYLFYTTLDNETKKPFNRIVRFTDVSSHGANETLIFDRIPASNGYHSGGAMAFGSDNKLYVTIGDATSNIKCGSLPNSTGAACPAQDTSSLLGKVLRINRDGSIPGDNPYPNSPVYNIGHLNMYGIAFDTSGFGLVSENGDSLYDEINTNEKGANYGSPTLQPFNTDPELSSNYTKPLRSYYTAYCLTQMIYYDGNRIPNLKGKFLVGSLSSTHSIFALDVNKISRQIVGEEVIRLNNFPYDEVVAIAQSPNGDLYYAGYAISKLNSVDILRKSQVLFPIEITYSSSISDINGLSFNPSSKEMAVNIDVTLPSVDTVKGNKSKSSNTYLQITIPKQLLDEIYSVKTNIEDGNTNQKSETLGFTRQERPSSNDTALEIYLKKQGHYKLLIFGNSSYG